MVDSPWMTPAECSTYAKRHVQTITNALRAGELRGSQPVRKGKWLVHRDDLDAWIREGSSPAPRRVRKASSAA